MKNNQNPYFTISPNRLVKYSITLSPNSVEHSIQTLSIGSIVTPSSSLYKTLKKKKTGLPQKVE
jgi:hypothetical protein